MREPQAGARRDAPGGGAPRLTLFVAGGERHSEQARRNLEAFCRAELAGPYRLEVVDVLQDFRPALEAGVLVTPCLVVWEPPPRVVIAGTLQDAGKVRAALKLEGGVP